MAEKNAETHKMRNEDPKSAGAEGKRPAGQNPAGNVLHQRRKLPFSPLQMAVPGFLIFGAIGYFTLYAKAKPDATARDVAKVVTGTSDDDRTRRSK